MVATDAAAQSETHRDTKEREPVKLGLHASVNPDTLAFTYAKDKHTLTFTVENIGESVEIFKIKTTASYLYRIRPVYFKLAVRERQEVTVTFKGMEAGPIPLSAKDRITVVFAHALDPRKSTAALWEAHKPFAHLSYAESREYVRVLFVDETGRLAVTAAQEKSRGGLDQRSIQGRSITMKPEPPRRSSAERDMTEPEKDEKSNNADYQDAPSNTPAPPQPKPAARTPRSPSAAKKVATPARSPSPAARSQQSPKEGARRSPASGRSRDPIESILSTVAKDASAIVCVQYPGKGYSKDEDSTVADEQTRDEDTNSKSKKEEDTKKHRDMDTDGRRDEVLRKKMDEMRRREDEEKTRRKREEEKREERKKSEEERKRKDEERGERKRKEEEREEKKRKEEEREERKKKEEEREEKKRAEEERKKAEDEAAAEDEKAAAKTPRRTSNEEVKQEQPPASPRETSSTRRRRVLGADGHYHDDDSRYLDEEIRRKEASVRLLKKGARTASRDNSAEDDNRPRRTSLEDDN